MKGKKFGYALFASLVAIVGIFGWVSYSKAAPITGTTQYLSGTALSQNFGLISFNCVSTGSCGSSNYSVKIDASGNLVGYAWANPRDTAGGTDNVGWLQFGGLNGFPSDTSSPSPTPSNAKIVGTGANQKIVGWARFCGAAVTPTGCAGNPGSQSGGWSGWVSFDGQNRNVSVAQNPVPSGSTNYPLSGYAWGADFVDSNGNGIPENGLNELVGAGWIDMSTVVLTGVDPLLNAPSFRLFGNHTATSTSANTLTFNLPLNGTLDLTWNTTKIVDPKGCVASGDWTGFKASNDLTSATGAHTEPTKTFTTAGTYTYTLNCTPLPSTGVPSLPSQSVIVKVVDVAGLAPLRLTAAPNPTSTNVTTLTYDTDPGVNFQSCAGGQAVDDATGVSTNVAGWTGNRPTLGGIITTRTVPNVSVPYNSTRFAISCYEANLNITVTQTVLVTRTLSTPQIDLCLVDPTGILAPGCGSGGNVTQNYPYNAVNAKLVWKSATNTNFGNCIGGGGESDWDTVSQSPDPTSTYFSTPKNRLMTPGPGSTIYTLTCDDLDTGISYTSNTATAFRAPEDLNPTLLLEGTKISAAGPYSGHHTAATALPAVAGDQVYLQWTTQDIFGQCKVSSVPTMWTGNRPPNGTDGAFTISGPTTFMIECPIGASGTTSSSYIRDYFFISVGGVVTNPPVGSKKPVFIEF